MINRHVHGRSGTVGTEPPFFTDKIVMYIYTVMKNNNQENHRVTQQVINKAK